MLWCGPVCGVCLCVVCACVWCVPACGVCLCVYDVGLCMFAAECVLCHLPGRSIKNASIIGQACVVIALHACFRL